MTPTSNNKIK